VRLVDKTDDEKLSTWLSGGAKPRPAELGAVLEPLLVQMEPADVEPGCV
jgi:hypothetical protein